MTGAVSRGVLAASVISLGLAVMAGWLLGIESLKSVVPGYSTMKFNTALAFVLVGSGLALVSAGHRLARWIAALCGAAVLLLGLLTLIQYVTGVELGIDELVVPDHGTLQGSGFPGRMSPLTAVAWLSLGPSLVILAVSQHGRWLRLAHAMSGVAGFISFLAAAGYAFGAEAFWGIGPYTYVAVHTAVGLMACVALTLGTRASEGWLGGLSDAPESLRLLRAFLPASVALPFGTGLILLLGAGVGAYNVAFAFAMFVPLMTAAFWAVGFRLADAGRQSELALRASEAEARERLAELEAIYESSPVGLAFITPDMRFLRVNRRLADLNGLPAADHIGRTIVDVLPEIAHQLDEIRRRLESGEPVIQHELSAPLRTDPTTTGYFLEYWLPLRTSDGVLRGYNVVVEDITERKQAEGRRKLLVDELNHRVRNTLAVVQSVARQTFAGDAASPRARAAFEERLMALAGAHAILTRENWEAADLRELVRAAAGAQAGADRFELSGPAVRLSPNHAVSLSLALHELATNAAKYGALSVARGRVRVEWSLPCPGRLALRWSETDGPTVGGPARRGFGVRMLERALAAELDGSVRLDFRPDGLVCEIEARIAPQE